MTRQPGFKAFDKRIKELLEKNRDIPPAVMLSLLQRADGNPALDIEKELERLRAAARRDE